MAVKDDTERTNRAILHDRSDSYYWKGKGALSIKTFKNGRAYYHAGQGHFAVEEGSYLLLNQGQEYAITIESDVPVESFCIFFPDKMVNEVYSSMKTSNEQLLDDPNDAKPTNIDFVEKTYSDHWLAGTLAQIKSQHVHHSLEQSWLDEKLHELAQGLLLVHRETGQERLRLHSLRSSTREELYKRLYMGHEYISAYYDQSISLSDMARAACLSTNHFLRSYKQLFGMSPHQYVTERRLVQAKKLLLQTDKPVTDICMEVGFQSVSSFSSLFARRFAASPSQFRRNR